MPTFEATAFVDDKFIVPYERNAHFAGREKLLALLRSKLSETVPKEWNHRVALFGLGGIGKTQLALEYVYSSRGYYERIYWISAVNEATLLSGFQEIAGKSRCVPNYVALQPQETAKKVIDWLGTQDKWLLVIDNLDEITVADGYLPVRSPGKHTLITTRNPNCQHIPAEGLKVGELDVEDAAELLLLRSGVEPSSERGAEATNIVKELGCLPLAIEQAAAYIRETSRDIFAYLPSYRKDRTRHHARISEGIRAYYKNTVATTWRMSFEQIEKRNSDASDLLRLLAYLNPDGILTEFLEAGASDASDGTVRDVISDHDRFYEALGELERFSFIGRQDDAVKGQRIIIHRLVQSVVKAQMSDVVRQAIERSLTNLCDIAFPLESSGSVESRTLSRRFQDQVMMPILAIDTSSPELGGILWRVGSFLLEDGKYQQAVDVLTKTVETRKMAGGIENRDTFNATMRLAHGYDHQGRFQDALSLRQNVVDVYMKLYGEHDAATLDAMAGLASSYYVLGRWKEAIILDEKVLNGRREVYGIEDNRTLISMSNLAETYRRLGRFEESVELGEECLEARKKVLGENNQGTLVTIANLAISYTGQGRLEEARKLEEKVLQVRVEILGPEHPDTLRSMSNLATTYVSLGRLEDGLKLQELSLERWRRTQGALHRDTLHTMMCLGDNYRQLGRLDSSITLLENSSAGLRETLGSKHPDTLASMNNLGVSYFDAGRFDDTVGLLETVVERRKNIFGEDDQKTRNSIEWLEKARQRQREGKPH